MKAVAAAAVVLAACGSGSDNKVHRGSAAPVELVPDPVRTDASAGSAGDTTGSEVEPNDALDVATPLAFGPLVGGTLDPADTDADTYRIDVAQPGALAVSVSPADGDLVVDIADSTGAVLAHSDRGKARAGVPNLGVGAGATYVTVRARPRAKPKKGQPPLKPLAPIHYKLSAELSPFAAGAEREPDDDRATANDLLLADKVSGFIGWDGDADVWKLSVDTLATGKDVIDVDVSKVDGVALELEIADGTGQPIATRKAPRGTPASIYNLVPVVPQGGSPYHYITIRGDRSNPLAPYELSVKVHPLDPDAEVEPDDSLEHPFAVPAERSVVHATWTPGDVDCFELATGPLVHTVDVAIDTPKDLDLSIDVLADGKVIAKSEHPGRGAAEHVTAKIPKSARTIIRVRGGDNAVTATGAYDLLIKDTGLPQLEP